MIRKAASLLANIKITHRSFLSVHSVVDTIIPHIQDISLVYLIYLGAYKQNHIIDISLIIATLHISLNFLSSMQIGHFKNYTIGVAGQNYFQIDA